MSLSSLFYHERLYRSDGVMRRIRDFPVTLCGAGALGANMAEHLARSGFGRLRIVDRDRIEERNLSTQPYLRSDIGAFKAKILANALYRAVGIAVEARAEELSERNAAKLLQGSALVLDTFDNSVGRQVVQDVCSRLNLPCLHIGLAADYAEIIWNEVYRVPSAARDDLCDYPLARSLVLMTTAVAGEVVIGFAARGERRSYSLTLGDFAVRAYSP